MREKRYNHYVRDENHNEKELTSSKNLNATIYHKIKHQYKIKPYFALMFVFGIDFHLCCGSDLKLLSIDPNKGSVGIL